MASKYGFVYVLDNESMPEIYKIGFTMGHPNDRMAQLSSATSCPTPFTLLTAFGCENPADVESDIHGELASYRVNRSREFFKVPLVILLEIIECHSNEWSDLCLLRPLRYKEGVEEKSISKQEKIDHFFSQCVDPIHWPEKFKGLD